MKSDSIVNRPERLLSLDVLRGFNMFWIVGGASMVIALAKAANLPLLDRVALQFTHVEWEGFRFYDLIFPLFLFMIGVAIPYALGSRIAHGVPFLKIYLHMIKRVAILFVFGLMINGRLLTYDIEKIQIYSVLQMLAFGYFFASVFFLHLRPRLQLVCTLMLLIGYWALLAFVPGPGHKIGVVAPGCNVGDWVNDALLGKWQGRFRFGWIVALMGHASTAMLGVFAGTLLRSSKLEPKQKAIRLAVWGVIALVVGILWSGWLAKWFPGLTITGIEWSEWPIWSPIIKNRWTSSYVLYAGGWSYLLLALFYLILDVYKFRWWIFPFRVIGVNALFAYLVYHICRPSLTACSKVFLGGLEQYTGEWHQLIMVFGTFLTLWLILWFLYKKQTFMKL